jgi:hypothetical protein
MAAPPLLWQHEIGQQAALGGPGNAEAQRSAPYNASEEKISNTWAHIKRVTQEGVKEYDLLDLLMNTSRDDIYLTSVPGVSLTVSVLFVKYSSISQKHGAYVVLAIFVWSKRTMGCTRLWLQGSFSCWIPFPRRPISRYIFNTSLCALLSRTGRLAWAAASIAADRT